MPLETQLCINMVVNSTLVQFASCSYITADLPGSVSDIMVAVFSTSMEWNSSRYTLGLVLYMHKYADI